MSRCSKCPGFYTAGFCGMVQLGLRTCGVKIGGNWIYYWLYQLYILMSLQSRDLSRWLLYRHTVVFRHRFPGGLVSKRWPRFLSYPRWESCVTALYTKRHAGLFWRACPVSRAKLRLETWSLWRGWDLRLTSVPLCSEMAAAVLHCCSFFSHTQACLVHNVTLMKQAKLHAWHYFRQNTLFYVVDNCRWWIKAPMTLLSQIQIPNSRAYFTLLLAIITMLHYYY